jgi:hypothetical protein
MAKDLCVCVCVCVCVWIPVRVCVCVRVALLIEHTTTTRYILFTFVFSLAPPYFSTLSHKSHHFRKKIIEHKMCVLTFSTTFIWNISNCKKNSARYCHNYGNLHMQCTRCSCPILMNLEFYGKIFEKKKKAQVPSFIKISPVVGELFGADGRTDGRTDRQTWQS